MTQFTLLFASILGGLAVVFGAFGAHALKKILSEDQLNSFETGVKYQMYHSIFLVLIGFNFKLLPKRSIIVNFTIYGQYQFFVFAKLRLFPRSWINNRKPFVSQNRFIIWINFTPIRTAMTIFLDISKTWGLNNSTFSFKSNAQTIPHMLFYFSFNYNNVVI